MPSVNDYYSAVQLRADRWSALRESAISLKREGNARRIARLQKRIEELFESLALIEPYLGVSRHGRLRSHAPAVRAWQSRRSRPSRSAGSPAP